ncbi:MAG: protein kinase [Rhodobacteraceae bacterium]|nr:protein kinase [Paracoccaceae bacterium]
MNTPEGILRSGELLNNTYVIEKLIGSGGTGEVYLAKNIVSGRKFAIKILKQEFSQNEAFINLMRREADVLHNVIDDAVVRYNELLKSEMHGGFVFLVMEFIAGQQLAEIMQATGAMAPDALLQVARRMGQGLAAAHAQNAFHRDISPDNIILPGGDPAKAKLIDFGIARDISENAQTVVGGGFAGKYQYASPEQLNGDVDARSDLYSLGVTLLNAYRGKSSQVGSSLMEIVQTKAQRVDTRDVPGQLGELISRLVEPRPEDRFQSANEMVQWLGGTPTTTAPVSTSPAPAEPAMITPSKPASSFQALPEEPGGGGLGKFIVLLLIAALGGGGWFFGFGPGKELVFPAKYEAESPYTIRARHDDGTNFITIAGFVRGPEAGAQMLTQLQLAYSEYTINPDLENASGEPNDRWEQIIVSMVKEAKPLNSWKVEMIDEAVSLSGEAESEASAAAVRAAFEATGRLVDVETSVAITVAVPPVPLAPLNELIATYQTCGPLRITGGDGTLLGPDDRITVSGIIARESDVEVFDLVLNEAAPGHGIDYNLGVLNTPVCEIEAMLPAPQDNGMELLYSYGQRDGEVGSKPFREGENPVIDVLIPGDQNGFLYAFYVDADGQVFHLIPHLSRQTHTVPPVGKAVDGKQRVRLTYPISEASTENLGFRVVAPFGTNMVVAILSKRPLFDSLRPRAESIAALQEALAPQANILNDSETLVVSRYLVTDP